MSTIMVIDDDPSILTMIEEVLIDEKYMVVKAESGEKAIALLPDARVDLIITDILMPNIDGMEVISKVKGHYPNVKVIAMSGGGRIGPQSYLPLAELIGADSVLDKPFPIELLVSQVGELLSAN